MAKGDTQLIISMVLVVTGSGLFLAGMGSKEWVTDVDHSNHTVTYGLWERCSHANGTLVFECSAIKPGASKAYFEATRVLECVTLLLYGLALCSCFTADDRHPSESCEVCVRRYVHAVAVFTAGLATLLIVAIFGACYKGDDWFLRSSLGVSYWLTFAGCICMNAGAVMRVVFIILPDRPTLPLHKQTVDVVVAPEAPRRRKKTRRDDELGPEALPTPLRPGETLHNHVASAAEILASEPEQVKDSRKKEKPHGIKRFFAFFTSNKSKASVAVAVVIRKGQGLDSDTNKGALSRDEQRRQTQRSQIDAVEPSSNPQPRLKPAIKAATIEGKDMSDPESPRRTRRYGRRHNSEQATRRKKNRVSIAEPFTGYNIPPTPGPDLPDMEETHQGDLDHRPGARHYELALGDEDLRTSKVSPPPEVVFPSAGEHCDNYDHHMGNKKWLDSVRKQRREKR